MSEEKILAAIGGVNANVEACRHEVRVMGDRISTLERRADDHDRALEHARIRDVRSSDADLKHETDLAAAAVAFSSLSSELHGLKGQVATLRAEIACAPGDVAKRVEATTTKAATDAVKKQRPNPYLHAAALFVGTSGGIFLATFLSHVFK